MPTVLKSGSLNLLEPSGPLQACNGIALPLPFTHFCYRLSRPQGRSENEIYNDTIGNRTRDLPACNTVSQPTAPPSAPLYINCRLNLVFKENYSVHLPLLSNYLSSLYKV